MKELKAQVDHLNSDLKVAQKIAKNINKLNRYYLLQKNTYYLVINWTYLFIYRKETDILRNRANNITLAANKEVIAVNKMVLISNNMSLAIGLIVNHVNQMATINEVVNAVSQIV